VFEELKQEIPVINFVPFHTILSIHQLDYLPLHTHTSLHVYANAYMEAYAIFSGFVIS